MFGFSFFWRWWWRWLYMMEFAIETFIIITCITHNHTHTHARTQALIRTQIFCLYRNTFTAISISVRIPSRAGDSATSTNKPSHANWMKWLKNIAREPKQTCTFEFVWAIIVFLSFTLVLLVFCLVVALTFLHGTVAVVVKWCCYRCRRRHRFESTTKTTAFGFCYPKNHWKTHIHTSMACIRLAFPLACAKIHIWNRWNGSARY